MILVVNQQSMRWTTKYENISSDRIMQAFALGQELNFILDFASILGTLLKFGVEPVVTVYEACPI
jgi:hypothetical protein